ncbi:hypothetical protein HQ314_04920 [Rhodococcus sp. BP-332]|uniref:hypothetical protein n=1 Tax=Rhodococcus sp. BP-332 TaxID=2739447 RepID=UPI001C9B796F|nr:hypothetical protein [Rhodococcus sp. BP-332]MBY6676257.1 hypothetical protein [Rhodococcus sp. BP-332]
MDVPGASQQCVDTALDRGVGNWVCNGAVLTTSVGNEVLPVVPRPNLVDPGAQRRADEPPDDPDLWCEPDSSSPCKFTRSENVAISKSNLIYGNEDGVLGTFDYYMRLNLNGRSARYTTTITHDEGPRLTFLRHDIKCRENIGGGTPDVNCGYTPMGSGFSVSDVPGNYSYTATEVQGPRLEDAGTYFAEGVVQFQPEGYDYVYLVPEVAGIFGPGPQSERYICPRFDGDCYFNYP